MVRTHFEAGLGLNSITIDRLIDDGDDDDDDYDSALLNLSR
jgi:hypothetical protein